MWVIGGLGNPGKEYENTRHNLGFVAVDEVARRIDCTFKKTKNSLLSEGFIGSEKVILIKPLTFMNLSGQAVYQVMSYYKCDLDRLIIIHDDLDIDAGKMKIRRGGGSGGHKGIESIIASIQSTDFLRIKMGIGKPELGTTEGYVLGRFGEEDEKLIKTVIEKAADAVEAIISEGYEKAMTLYNA